MLDEQRRLQAATEETDKMPASTARPARVPNHTLATPHTLTAVTPKPDAPTRQARPLAAQPASKTAPDMQRPTKRPSLETRISAPTQIYASSNRYVAQLTKIKLHCVPFELQGQVQQKPLTAQCNSCVLQLQAGDISLLQAASAHEHCNWATQTQHPTSIVIPSLAQPGNSSASAAVAYYRSPRIHME
jgi:hypothetical protein